MLQRIARVTALLLRANVHVAQALLIALERIEQDAVGDGLVTADRTPLDQALDARRINPEAGIIDDYGPD
jgi:hypothetical protein